MFNNCLFQKDKHHNLDIDRSCEKQNRLNGRTQRNGWERQKRNYHHIWARGLCWGDLPMHPFKIIPPMREGPTNQPLFKKIVGIPPPNRKIIQNTTILKRNWAVRAKFLFLGGGIFFALASSHPSWLSPPRIAEKSHPPKKSAPRSRVGTTFRLFSPST